MSSANLKKNNVQAAIILIVGIIIVFITDKISKRFENDNPIFWLLLLGLIFGVGLIVASLQILIKNNRSK